MAARQANLKASANPDGTASKSNIPFGRSVQLETGLPQAWNARCFPPSFPPQAPLQSLLDLPVAFPREEMGEPDRNRGDASHFRAPFCRSSGRALLRSAGCVLRRRASRQSRAGQNEGVRSGGRFQKGPPQRPSKRGPTSLLLFERFLLFSVPRWGRLVLWKLRRHKMWFWTLLSLGAPFGFGPSRACPEPPSQFICGRVGSLGSPGSGPFASATGVTASSRGRGQRRCT